RNKDLTEAECFMVEKLKKEGMSAAKIEYILEEVYDQSCTQATVKSGQKSIMVWGCVNGYNLPHLVRCPPRMNGEAYGEIIVDAVYPIIMATDDAIFQEDGARIHISKPVKKIKAELGIVPIKWPPYSLDLSPIENVWREVKCWIHKNRKPRNQPDLEEAVTVAWNNVAFETTLQFIDSMPDRVKEVIKKKRLWDRLVIIHKIIK
ncbi:3053_t:CDS:2, partial [Racocetra persica]